VAFGVKLSGHDEIGEVAAAGLVFRKDQWKGKSYRSSWGRRSNSTW
jgi:hypothetical protein